MQETWVCSLGLDDPLEEEMATHSSMGVGNSVDGGAWWAIVSGVAKSQTQLNDWARSTILSLVISQLSKERVENVTLL